MAGTDDAVDPRALGQIGQTQRLIMGIALDADVGQIAIVEAGQHGDGDHLGVLASGGLGVFHHGAATGGMDRHDAGLQHMDRLHRARHRVGNIVQLQVEENRQADLGQLMHAVMAMGAEELQPQLDPADMGLHLARQGFGGIEAGQVKGEIERVAVHDGDPMLKLIGRCRRQGRVREQAQARKA
jgi:hypothetical protein